MSAGWTDRAVRSWRGILGTCVVLTGMGGPVMASELELGAKSMPLFVRQGGELRQVIEVSVSFSVEGKGGNPPLAGGTDESGPFTYTDLHHPFEEDVEVAVWEVFCVRPGNIQFRVYRRTEDALELAGQSELVEMETGLNRFWLEEPIAAERGDCVGFWIPGSAAIAADHGGQMLYLGGRRDERTIPFDQWMQEPKIASLWAYSAEDVARGAKLEEVLEAAELRIHSGLEERTVRLTSLPELGGGYALDVAEVEAPTDVEITLTSGDVTLKATVTVGPERHWEVCLVPIAHHDLGYTQTIEEVLQRYEGFYDDVLRFCDQTADWPPEARFRYTIEGA